LTSPFALQATLLVLVGTGLGLVVARLTRMRAISFRFTLAWAVIAAIAILAVPLLPLVEAVAARLALSPSALLTVAVSAVLLAIALQLSVTVSRLGMHTDELAIAFALSSAPSPPGAGEITGEAPSVGRASRAADALVIVPAYNEQRSVGDVVRRARATGLDVVVVDDGSSDATAEVATQAGAAVLRLPTNLGVGAALRTGFRLALRDGYTRVVQCDGDGQHAPEEILRLLEEQRSRQVDLLIGSRFLTGEAARPPAARRFAMRVLSRSASRAAGVPITDATSGFRVVSSPLLEEFAARLPNHYLGDTYEAVVAAGRAGFRIAEVPVPTIARSHGSSSASALAATTFTVRVLAVVGIRAHAPFRPARVSRSGS
jgi:GT2 family glycosyltransferase